MESLEPRLPLAVGRAYGTWTIAGDANPARLDDTILVARDAAHPGMLKATIEGIVVGMRKESTVSLVRVFGGKGDDSITIDVPGNTRIRTQLYGDAGNDTVSGSDQNDEIYGGAGNDVLFGGKGSDKIWGGTGNDTINGGAGNDWLGGGAGSDKVWGRTGNDTINGGAGSDWLRGGAGNDVLFGGKGGDAMWGGADNDAINGGPGNDWLSGGDGNDSLVGGAGDDALQGDVGSDSLRGGDGRNVFDGGAGRDSFYGAKDRDTVRRFDTGESLIGNESTNPLRLATGLDQLKSWYLEMALAQWGSHLGKNASSWWGGVVPLAGGQVATASTAANPPATRDFSGTNNQVAGVDEGDTVKTDGQHLFVLAGDGVDIVDAWPAESLAVVGHVSTEGDERALFLHGTRLTVISQESSWIPESDGGTGASSPFVCWLRRWHQQVNVTVIDVSNKAHPAVVEKTSLDGWLIDARAIDGRVLVVTRDSLAIPSPGIIAIPSPDPKPAVAPGVPVFVAAGTPSAPRGVASAPIGAMPIRIGDDPSAFDGKRYVYENAATYRARLAKAWNETVLPRFTVTVAGRTTSGSLVSSGQTYLPVDPTDGAVLSVSSFNVDDGTAGFDATTAVAGVSGTVHASTSHLTVSAGHVGNWWDATDAATTTNLYRFDLTNAAVPLTAMGSIPGLTLDQFSIDESDGLLRVATTDGFGSGSSNGVYVLAASGANLQTVGSISGLARGERIFSVRFVGDLGYVSTFREIDPLFVVDLANPARPRVVGELKIPGFSSYLQPLDGTHLLGVGRDVDPDTGRIRGLELSIFDVADPTKPKRTATYTFAGDGWESWSAALWDHHALSWFPDQGILAIPVQQGSRWDGSSGLVVFKLDPANQSAFAKLGEITHEGDVQRSLRIGGFLYSVSAGEVKVHPVSDPEQQVAAVRLSQPETGGVGPIFAL